MKCYLGILILTGYNDLPGQRFYWDSDSDMRNHLVYNSMRRDRFLQISRFIHFADNNNPDISDKIWKMRPLMDKVKSKFLEHFQPEEHLCYDESMIKYFGKHSCKQFIREIGDIKALARYGKIGYLENALYRGKRHSKNIQGALLIQLLTREMEFYLFVGSITVTRPNVIGTYNSHMGGTDLMDENISRYRIGVRGKKWWWCLFTWMLDACMQNAWQLHKKSKGTLPQLEFRREIVKSYLKSFGTQPKGAGRTSTSTSSVTLNRVSDDLRYDKRDHFVVRIPQNKRRRCAGEGCASSGEQCVINATWGSA
ncbi:hypothetical protein NQ315_008979 [Exocentrus adspersus]|uniref:PiggyBac transposable element-derived protein domain-containing protein n=1 Tax=Exocentrus adspersus TaxID=1586481 RepID=A0AAV8VJ99_9CUCU|nr:hypothetical protein NQ315_008979 [Exocentrus adspersus]